MEKTLLQIRETRTELDVTTKEETTTFLDGFWGPYKYSQAEALKLRTIRPTFKDVVNLVYIGFNFHGEYSDKIRQKMDYGFWGFTGILYVPNDGVYIQDYPLCEDYIDPCSMFFNRRVVKMDKADLIKRLEAHDPNVRFVNLGFKTGEMTSAELARNSFVRALTGEEGAEKLANIADKHEKKPYLSAFNSVDKPLIRVSGLRSGGVSESGLCVQADIYNNDNWGNQHYFFEIKKRKKRQENRRKIK